MVVYCITVSSPDAGQVPVATVTVTVDAASPSCDKLKVAKKASSRLGNIVIDQRQILSYRIRNE